MPNVLHDNNWSLMIRAAAFISRMMMWNSLTGAKRSILVQTSATVKFTRGL